MRCYDDYDDVSLSCKSIADRDLSKRYVELIERRIGACGAHSIQLRIEIDTHSHSLTHTHSTQQWLSWVELSGSEWAEPWVHRVSKGTGRPPAISGNNWTTTNWLVFVFVPVLVLVCMFVLVLVCFRYFWQTGVLFSFSFSFLCRFLYFSFSFSFFFIQQEFIYL